MRDIWSPMRQLIRKAGNYGFASKKLLKLSHDGSQQSSVGPLAAVNLARSLGGGWTQEAPLALATWR